eukprot:CAMPEP_0115582752 /NCGR_PEP_ID=MMETSP0272-20121206/5824_1 /TAXON_ID=71861 /ORGANISM="Scrippsiella trochoidea, Strain CCMP3099" /LENGTH=187 /DNA_ID=CAMNT_0003017753 /DNA_START=396 /DNA_END=960 /DNA_ORIENTATION=-
MLVQGHPDVLVPFRAVAGTPGEGILARVTQASVVAPQVAGDRGDGACLDKVDLAGPSLGRNPWVRKGPEGCHPQVVATLPCDIEVYLSDTLHLELAIIGNPLEASHTVPHAPHVDVDGRIVRDATLVRAHASAVTPGALSDMQEYWFKPVFQIDLSAKGNTEWQISRSEFCGVVGDVGKGAQSVKQR